MQKCGVLFSSIQTPGAIRLFSSSAKGRLPEIAQWEEHVVVRFTANDVVSRTSAAKPTLTRAAESSAFPNFTWLESAGGREGYWA
jgi:hypothetical protein